nr:uncharacterized protein LOC117850408 [Setaria viridis]
MASCTARLRVEQIDVAVTEFDWGITKLLLVKKIGFVYASALKLLPREPGRPGLAGCRRASGEAVVRPSPTVPGDACIGYFVKQLCDVQQFKVVGCFQTFGGLF